MNENTAVWELLNHLYAQPDGDGLMLGEKGSGPVAILIRWEQWEQITRTGAATWIPRLDG